MYMCKVKMTYYNLTEPRTRLSDVLSAVKGRSLCSETWMLIIVPELREQWKRVSQRRSHVESRWEL